MQERKNKNKKNKKQKTKKRKTKRKKKKEKTKSRQRGIAPNLSLVAVDEDGMVAAIQDDAQSRSNFLIGHRRNTSFLVSRHADLMVGDSVFLQESGIFFRIRFRHQGSRERMSNSNRDGE